MFKSDFILKKKKDVSKISPVLRAIFVSCVLGGMRFWCGFDGKLRRRNLKWGYRGVNLRRLEGWGRDSDVGVLGGLKVRVDK